MTVAGVVKVELGTREGAPEFSVIMDRGGVCLRLREDSKMRDLHGLGIHCESIPIGLNDAKWRAFVFGMGAVWVSL